VMGDGVLVEFASAVNAVACAAELQRRLSAANDGVADERRIVLRIGINLGDVVVEDGDLFGDGVNVAARLQALAEPGGIHISGSVYDQVKNKLAIACDNLGSHAVKNIAEPVRVYRVGLQSQVASVPEKPAAGPARRRLRLAALGLLALIVVAAVAVYSGLLPLPVALGGRSPVASLPGKAAIAVLPFANLSADPAQAYFGDGLSEDVIAALGRFSDLTVIASAAVQQYKGRSPSPEDLRRDLGVRYALEGSVARDGDHVRIKAQLIDTTNGVLLWSDSYDGAAPQRGGASAIRWIAASFRIVTRRRPEAIIPAFSHAVNTWLAV